MRGCFRYAGTQKEQKRNTKGTRKEHKRNTKGTRSGSGSGTGSGTGGFFKLREKGCAGVFLIPDLVFSRCRCFLDAGVFSMRVFSMQENVTRVYLDACKMNAGVFGCVYLCRCMYVMRI